MTELKNTNQKISKARSTRTTAISFLGWQVESAPPLKGLGYGL